jgi:hypothetical protein
MPGFDGTGPRGRGPRNGEARGCRRARNRAVRRDGGRGRCLSNAGDGRGRRFTPNRGETDEREPVAAITAPDAS